MIRQHEALDFLSAEAAPSYFGAGMPAKTHPALLPGAPVQHDSLVGQYRAPPHDSPAIDPAGLPLLILLVIAVVSVLALWKYYRETLRLRRVRDRYRAFIGGLPAAAAVPVGLNTGQPLR